MPNLLLVGAMFSALCMARPPIQAPGEIAPSWCFWLHSPGGQLPFEVSFSSSGGELTAQIHNGAEVIEAGSVSLKELQLVIRLAPYDSELRAELSPDGKSLRGTWSKSLGGKKRAQLPLSGSSELLMRFPASVPTTEQRSKLDGRWAVQFKSDEHLSIGTFVTFPDGRARGTFETTLGDYRFLDGVFDGKLLRLSCFDGGHAFLFEATLAEDGTLAGDFYSRDSWHETWTAHRDAEAKLPDPFGLSAWNSEVELKELAFPDLEGVTMSLADPAFAGRARIISLFGTWCPNCNDEARFLAELDKQYGARGLSILGIAFELDDDFERSCRQVRRFQALHGTTYPVLIAGESDKAKATQAFRALDRVRAYPTAIFLDRNNKVRAIHTGFSGPATGAAHDHMRERYEALLEELLTE